MFLNRGRNQWFLCRFIVDVRDELDQAVTYIPRFIIGP